MQAIEFETDLINSTIKVPASAKIKNRHVRVILMYEKQKTGKNIKSKDGTDIFDKFKINIDDNTFDRNEANER